MFFICIDNFLFQANFLYFIKFSENADHYWIALLCLVRSEIEHMATEDRSIATEDRIPASKFRNETTH